MLAHFAPRSSAPPVATADSFGAAPRTRQPASPRRPQLIQIRPQIARRDLGLEPRLWCVDDLRVVRRRALNSSAEMQSRHVAATITRAVRRGRGSGAWPRGSLTGSRTVWGSIRFARRGRPSRPRITSPRRRIVGCRSAPVEGEIGPASRHASGGRKCPRSAGKTCISRSLQGILQATRIAADGPVRRATLQPK